ncbi:MAG TPA: universal stress protein [Polyangiaceae bacterium]|nr:universal stress protein [Polyangiaceae bacterium]
MIICGTDLSPASEPAVRCAAAIAKQREQDLLLVTVQARDDVADRGAAELRLESDAAPLRRDFGISVETRVAHGDVVEQLLQLCAGSDVELLVVGAKGGSGRSRRLGGVPERVCQTGTIPVLVARNADGVEAWSRHTRPLRVLLGSGLGDASSRALDVISSWSELALTVAYVAWPFGEHYRLGVKGPMPLDHLRPEVHHQLIGDLGRWASRPHAAGAVKLSVTPGWGRVDTHLAQLAQEKEADLLVVGSHRRNLAERIWQGSISRNAIHEADCNVLCVPQGTVSSGVARAPSVVVIPTDFSQLADRALAVGYSLLGRGGTAHLVHVLDKGSDNGAAGAATSQLQQRVPVDAESRGLTTVLHVLEDESPWLAVWQYAGRVSADLICMSTHSRDKASRLVLGSQAQELLQHSRIPVVLVPPDREG